MKKLLFILSLICAVSIYAQTPFDSFDTSMAKIPIYKSQNPQKFRIEVADTTTNSKTKFVELDIENHTLEYYDNSNQLIATTVLKKGQVKFLSVDPLTNKYPELTPYQFASNRPIDGIDRDGLEYATFRINVDKNNNVTKITVTTDYQLKNNGTLGPGIKYYITKGSSMPEGSFVKNIYGIYQGGDNPQLPKIGQNYKKVYDDYSLKPIDEADANAKQHDIDYDNAVPGGLKGVKGILEVSSTKANQDYAKRANIIIGKQKTGGIDIITGQPVTKEAADAAKFGKKWFGVAEYLKKDKNEGKTKEQILLDNGPKF